MYVFGGYNEGNCHNDIYAFDLIRHHWTHIETSNSISPGKNQSNPHYQSHASMLLTRECLSV